MQTHYPPKHRAKQFHCIHCGVYASQLWQEFYYNSHHAAGMGKSIHQELNYCVCTHCSKWTYWFNGRMIIPADAPVPPAHADMPEECRGDYDEARSVVGKSPRSASALMRLALQKLMAVVGEKGKNINEDIGSLVKKGLPREVQQALDFCRVVGNNAVHPGELDLNDTPEIAHQMFAMMNFIVEDRITRPKQIASLYQSLPEGARDAIVKRDAGEG